jgi:phage terminase large subunit-like protein
LRGKRVNKRWPVYLSGQQLSYIHTGTDAQKRCWLWSEAERESYYREQRETLRPATFERLHLNQWANAEGSFIDQAAWEALIDPSHRPLEPGAREVVYLGLDAALAPGGDDCVLTGVYRDGDKTRLAFHQIWRGKSRKTPLKLGETVLPTVALLSQAYSLASLTYDPWQCAHLANELGRVVRTVAMPQSLSARGEADTELWRAICNKTLVLYDDDEVRRATAGASAKELPDGRLFLQKSSGRSRIDFLVSLSMAHHAANKPRGVYLL